MNKSTCDTNLVSFKNYVLIYKSHLISTPMNLNETLKLINSIDIDQISQGLEAIKSLN